MMSSEDGLHKRSGLSGVADLARSGGEGASSPFARVRYEIHHHVDKPGIYRNLLTRDPDGPLGKFDYHETLTFAAHGVGLVIGTALDQSTSGRGMGVTPAASSHLAEDERDSRTFTGETHPNPSFLYESVTVLEGLISIELEPAAFGGRDGLAVRELLATIAHLAAVHAKAPLLSVQFPVQAPAHRFTGDGTPDQRSVDWPRSSATCLRFSLAIGDAGASHRSQLLKLVAAYCERRGYGFWINDLRPDHRSGNWFQIRPHDKAGSREFVRSLELGRGQNSSWVLPVTFVGPARVGSTNSVVQALMRAEGLGLTGISITSLDDLAFVHLQLHIPVDSGSEYRGVVAALDTLGFPLERPMSRSLRELVRALGVARYDLPETVEATLDERTSGYAVLCGPPLQRLADHTLARRSVWISWEMPPGSSGLADPLLALYAATDQLLEVRGVQRSDRTPKNHPLYPNIEYLVSRNVGVGAYRAKGKLAVPDALVKRLFPGAGRTEGAVRLVSALEESWLGALGSANSLPREVTIAWRENWLGRWSSLSG